jgi:amidohydrolase
MFLTESDLAEITAFRRALHARPEVSGEEQATAAAVCEFIAPTAPDLVLTGLGGHGVAAVFDSGRPGPTVLLRAELDGLPIEDTATIAHRSRNAGKGHQCGHDGHTATLTALARGFARQRPARGRAVLMFQPAEENGAGAAAVIADPRFARIAPDMSFAWHNVPGIPFGHASIIEGPVNCASRGMRISLSGRTSHASQPENGISPMQAVASLMPALTALGGGETLDPDFALVTVTHCRMGEPAFGVAPGAAQIWATLRTLTDDRMDALVARAEALARQAAAAGRLGLDIAYDDIFAHVDNAAEAVARLRQALDAEQVPHDGRQLPFRASEDFGRFGQKAPAAMMFIGAGESHVSLHNPDYDFPDALIPIAARVMMRAARDMLG